MSRLTNAKRDAIRKQLIERAFEQKRMDMKRRGYDIFNRLIAAAWMGQFKTIYAMYKEWPLLFDSDISIYFHRRGKTDFSIEGDYTMPTPNDWGSMSDDEVKNYHSVVDPPLGDNLRRYVEDQDKLLAEIDDAKHQVDSILGACFTYKKLYEVWPELNTVAPLVQIEPETTTGQWLAPNMPQLNAVLNLPSEPPML